MTVASETIIFVTGKIKGYWPQNSRKNNVIQLKLFCKNLQNSWEHKYARASFQINLQTLGLQRPQYRCLPVKILIENCQLIIHLLKIILEIIQKPGLFLA